MKSSPITAGEHSNLGLRLLFEWSNRSVSTLHLERCLRCREFGPTDASEFEGKVSYEAQFFDFSTGETEDLSQQNGVILFQSSDSSSSLQLNSIVQQHPLAYVLCFRSRHCTALLERYC